MKTLKMHDSNVHKCIYRLFVWAGSTDNQETSCEHDTVLASHQKRHLGVQCTFHL